MADNRKALSDSEVQTKAEADILDALGRKRHTALIQKPTWIDLGGGTHIEVDAVSDDRTVVVEAYACQGRLKGAQLKKIAQDILKLALVKHQPGWGGANAIIVFASPEAHDSISGWLRLAAETFGIEFEVVHIPDTLREEILRAQQRQLMVNADQVADDIAFHAE
jgi:hypothetical protein